MTDPASNIHVIGPRIPQPNEQLPPHRDLWKARLLLVLEVLFFVELGVMLTVLPWTHIWTENPLLNSSYRLRQLAGSGFLRGLVTGLGLINLWIAISDAVNYRE